jgi:hypothetical protein
MEKTIESPRQASAALMGTKCIPGFRRRRHDQWRVGNDRSIYTDATGGITVDLAAGKVSGPGVGSDTLTGIEQIQGSNFADGYSALLFTGVSGVPGVPAALSFEGMAGDDVIVGSVNVQGPESIRASA